MLLQFPVLSFSFSFSTFDQFTNLFFQFITLPFDLFTLPFPLHCSIRRASLISVSFGRFSYSFLRISFLSDSFLCISSSCCNAVFQFCDSLSAVFYLCLSVFFTGLCSKESCLIFSCYCSCKYTHPVSSIFCNRNHSFRYHTQYFQEFLSTADWRKCH